jgi:glycerol-3-phosphate dehydrogenase
MSGSWRREEALERLAGQELDVLVVGAGVIGASTAWHAAAAGARVGVIDRDDVAAATSSASTKLLHGGLRYLAMGDLRLVREAHRERWATASVVAPHLVRPLPFVIPVREQTPLPLWRARAGVWTYAALSRYRDGDAGRIPLTEARRLVPGLRRDAIRSAVLYHDHQTNDARLTVAVLGAAAAAGAVVCNHLEVVALRTGAGGVVGAEVADRLGGAAFPIAARAVVNATGPWVDRLRALESTQAGTSVRLSKGAHVLLQRDHEWQAAVTTPLRGGRVSFAIPWEGMLLLGTTDEPFDGDPAEVSVSERDVVQIVSEAARSLDPALIDPGRIRASFAGVRALPVGPGGTSSARREVVVTTGPAGMVSVAGGKLTTWRTIGLAVAETALRRTGGRMPSAEPAALPGAAPPAAVEAQIASAHPGIDPATRAHLAMHYGRDALPLLEAADAAPELLEPLAAGGPDIGAQIAWARDHEWAATPADAVRRTTLRVRGLDGRAALDRAAAIMNGA